VLFPTAKLVRWLGPWAKEDRAPSDVVRTELTLEDEVRAYLYRPRQRAFGAYLIAPGLHYLTYAFADPRPHLARARCPAVVVHGKDDDVIPWIEAEKIASALPAGHPHRVLVTGMAGHTGSSLPGPGALAREVKTLLEVVRALATAPLTR
jgi:pimeloyl-ACP methyl ester carboxylesterase